MFLIKSFWHFVDEILEKPFIYDLFIINKKKKWARLVKQTFGPPIVIVVIIYRRHAK